MKKLSLLLIPFVLLACKKQDESDPVDEQKPTIGSLTIANGKTKTVFGNDEIGVSLDSTVTMTLSVSDNKCLSQAKVEVHNAFDHHTHESKGRAKSEEDKIFAFNKVFSLSGTSGEVTAELWNSSKENHYKSGDYHIEVILLDKEGNRVEKVYTLEIKGEDGHGH